MATRKYSVKEWIYAGGGLAIISGIWFLATALTVNSKDISQIKKDLEKKVSIEVAIELKNDIEQIKKAQCEQTKITIDIYKMISEKK